MGCKTSRGRPCLKAKKRIAKGKKEKTLLPPYAGRGAQPHPARPNPTATSAPRASLLLLQPTRENACSLPATAGRGANGIAGGARTNLDLETETEPCGRRHPRESHRRPRPRSSPTRGEFARRSEGGFEHQPNANHEQRQQQQKKKKKVKAPTNRDTCGALGLLRRGGHGGDPSGSYGARRRDWSPPPGEGLSIKIGGRGGK